jgi:hypothetical protein
MQVTKSKIYASIEDIKNQKIRNDISIMLDILNKTELIKEVTLKRESSV